MRAMNSIWVEEGSGWQDVTTSSVRYVDDMDIPKKEEDLSTMINTKPNPEFELGEIVATPGAIEAMNATGTNPTHLLDRHVSGDWGDICAEDAKMNNEDLASGEGRLMSVYQLTPAVKVWVMTEWDKSYTTILLPSEY